MEERFMNLLWAGTREHTMDWGTSIWLCRPCFMRAQRILQELLAIGTMSCTCQARHWFPSDACLDNQIQSLDAWTILSAGSQLCTVDRCFTISHTTRKPNCKKIQGKVVLGCNHEKKNQGLQWKWGEHYYIRKFRWCHLFEAIALTVQVE